MNRTQMGPAGPVGAAGQVAPAGPVAPAGQVGAAGQMSRADGAGQPPGGAITEIRRADPADLAALSDFFAGLSLRTRFLRFFAPVTPAPAVLRRLAGGTGDTDAVVALRGGVIIGHAMAVDSPSSRGQPVTEIGVVVADAWQSQGVGSALTRTLISRAQARGVTSLTMDVMHGNHQVLAMIASHWTLADTDRYADCVTVRVPLPQRRQRPLASSHSRVAIPAAATARMTPPSGRKSRGASGLTLAGMRASRVARDAAPAKLSRASRPAGPVAGSQNDVRPHR